jgi:transcriptional regulator with XRE-family HTH domain
MTEPLDWKAASDAASARRAELKLTQEDVIERMGEFAINIEAYRRFERNDQESYRRRTLATISEALDWPADHLWAIAEGRVTPARPPSQSDLEELRAEIASLRETVQRIADAVSRIAQSDEEP